MKDVFQKLTSYNIFNCLLPGIVFVILLRYFTSHNLMIDEALSATFFYYFIGLIISRIGSLIVEPLLRKFKIVNFSAYRNFVETSKIDDKIELLSEINNIYRTLLSMLILILLIITYEGTPNFFELGKSTKSIIGLVSLILLFLCSYKKQTEYMNKRINDFKK